MNSFRSWLFRFSNSGVSKEYLPWEIALTRKLNQLSLVSFINVFIVSIVFLILKEYTFLLIGISVLILTPIIYFVNKHKGYIAASYLFYFVGFVLLNPLALTMGSDSLIILNYFPVIISVLQMYGRKELLKHMIVLFSLCLISVIGIISYYYSMNYIAPKIDPLVKSINILFSVTSTIIFMVISSLENYKKEELISKYVKEKEVLLAEVFHRVKNNMNIITSILNLKKHMSESEEVQVAMEECRNRVFSMALVHKRIYQTNNISSINLKDYARELLDELINGMGGEDELELDFQAENIDIDLNKAIPCGLIINELVTNSFKYAKIPGKKLKLIVRIKSKEEQIYINIQDNGPGMSEEKKTESLGMLLIESLSEQISGAYAFENKDGLLFRLCFDK